MSRASRLPAAAALLALLGSGLNHAAPASASPVIPIAVIGDSYTEGSGEGGTGPNSWPQVAWSMLAQQGLTVDGAVAAEGAAGYGHRGVNGDLFRDLLPRVVRPDDALVVFFGSRNDELVDPLAFAGLAADTLLAARLSAPAAKFLVIGPLWPVAAPPPEVLRARDILSGAAGLVGAVFVDPIAEGWFDNRPDLIGGDRIHPNDAGHVYLAEKIAPLIYEQLAPSG